MTGGLGPPASEKEKDPRQDQNNVSDDAHQGSEVAHGKITSSSACTQTDTPAPFLADIADRLIAMQRDGRISVTGAEEVAGWVEAAVREREAWRDALVHYGTHHMVEEGGGWRECRASGLRRTPAPCDCGLIAAIQPEEASHA